MKDVIEDDREAQPARTAGQGERADFAFSRTPAPARMCQRTDIGDALDLEQLCEQV
jgi:hypothetical protein